jgi:hypothetical protein
MVNKLKIYAAFFPVICSLVSSAYLSCCFSMVVRRTFLSASWNFALLFGFGCRASFILLNSSFLIILVHFLFLKSFAKAPFILVLTHKICLCVTTIQYVKIDLGLFPFSSISLKRLPVFTRLHVLKEISCNPGTPLRRF